MARREKLIHETLPNIELLVDSNDEYTLQEAIDLLTGIGDIPLLRVEEPFRQHYEVGKKLRKWMTTN